MNLESIKFSIENLNYKVFWKNENYQVIKDSIGQWLILSKCNGHCIGLTHKDGKTLNGKESEFYFEKVSDFFF